MMVADLRCALFDSANTSSHLVLYVFGSQSNYLTNYWSWSQTAT